MARRPATENYAAAGAQAVPRFGRGDTRDLVSGFGCGRRRIAKDAERLHARRLELTHDQLAVSSAGAPVDPAQRIARPVLANAEHFRSRAGARRGNARFHLSGMGPVGKRFESRQDEGELRIAALAVMGEESEGVPRLDGQASHSNRAAAKRTE